MRKQTKLPRLRDDARLPVQAIRYGAAAFGGFAADYGTLLLLKEIAGLHYLVAVPLAFLVGIAVNYFIGVWFVFRRGALPLKKELALFLVISLLALAVTEGSMYLFTGVIRVDYRISRVLSGVLTYLFNFFSRRMLLYRAAGKDEREGRAER